MVLPTNLESRARGTATRIERGNYGHTDATRRRLSEATALAIAEGRFGRSSRCEDTVADVLTAAGIGYRRQEGVRGADGRFMATLDFLLADGIALEVNGTFWHADPRTYPDGPAFPAQRRTAERWARKLTVLAAQRIPLAVVWEADLAVDPLAAVLAAVAAARVPS